MLCVCVCVRARIEGGELSKDVNITQPPSQIVVICVEVAVVV